MIFVPSQVFIFEDPEFKDNRSSGGQYRVSPSPLVVSLHGGGNQEVRFRNMTGETVRVDLTGVAATSTPPFTISPNGQQSANFRSDGGNAGIYLYRVELAGTLAVAGSGPKIIIDD